MISRCSSPMPAMITWPVCCRCCTRKVGSSAISFCRPDAELLLVGLGLRLDRQRDDRLREVHRLEHDRLLLVAQRVAGRDALEADRRGDVAGVDFLDFLALVRVHLQQAADALGALLGRVVDASTRREHARVDAEERELADERVGHDLERQRAERRVVGRRALDRCVRSGRLLSGSMPLIAGTSSGDGRKSTTASSSGCTPLFLNAEPQMTGTNAAFALGAHRAVHALAQRRLDFVFGDAPGRGGTSRGSCRRLR